ncbi:MAG TPA: hypothetical protein PLT82_01755 [Candidatus Hydrogenedens sp.]|nr:hypothetical protein [Candidatus Hydrogenedens sp.]HOL20341.1 hypothetical protein [Candidatus Hydrogenedens sp.]HPP57835.1 hypothetical protein [Candidatus Hydrogenedens sp.]
MKHTKLLTQKVAIPSKIETASTYAIISIVATVLTAVAGLLSAIAPLIANKG